MTLRRQKRTSFLSMRLLICTQSVDMNDPVLGFFHRWIEEFAERCEQVIVVCLRKGEYALPANVEVITLGERNRALRAVELCAISWGRRREYDAVFAHMSPEFVVVSGWLWRLLRKKVGLWYVHKSVTLWLRLAIPFVHRVFTASKESLRVNTPKRTITGHGIDTDFFMPDRAVPRGNHLLSAGRLDKSKNHTLIIQAAKKAGLSLRIAGDGPEKEALAMIAKETGAKVEFLGGLTQAELLDEYRRAAHFVHTSTTGGMDKVVLEAAACDCDVITTVDWLHTYFPVHSVAPTPEAIAHAALENARKSADRVSIIRAHHSLHALIPKILAFY